MEHDSPDTMSVIEDPATKRPCGSCIQGLSEDSDVELDLDLTGSVNAEEDPDPSGIMETVVVSYGTPNFTDGTQKEFTYDSQRYPGVVFHYRKYNSMTKRSVARAYYRCVACWNASGKETKTNARCFGGFVVVLDGSTIDNDPDDPQFATGHLCQGGQLTGWSPQDAAAETHPVTAPKRRMRSFESRTQEDSGANRGLDVALPPYAPAGEASEPKANKELPALTFGKPNFTDETQKEFALESKRYPGVTFYFRLYMVNVQSRMYYHCSACWESSEKQRNARCFGGFAIVQGGHIVGHDPDYPPFSTGHPCQGGQLTHWPSAPVSAKKPSTSRMPAKALTKPKKEAHDVVVEDFAAHTPKRLRRSTSTLQEAAPSSSTPSSSSSIPSFGAAIREPRGTAVFYRSIFYPDHVFKFAFTGQHLYDGKMRRFYYCTDCQALGQQQPVPVITEEHRFVIRDPDWPANAPHACMQSGHFSKHQLPS